MAVLDQGVVQQVGTPAELYDEPVNAFVANFVGTMNMLDAKVRSLHSDNLVLDIAGVGEMTIPVSHTASQLYLKDQHVQLSFRPHSVTLEAKTPRHDERSIGMHCTVEASEFMGELTRYRVRLGTQFLSFDQAHHAGLPKFPAGTPLNLMLAPSQIRLFAV
jgi:iron(III) transport system ATP-binding protein